MTLVEVVAGLVVLATVFAAVAVARGRFLRQWSDADRQLRAARAADALLAGWLDGPPDRVPARGDGPLAGADGFTWRTRPTREPTAERLGARAIRLEVFGPAGSESPAAPPEGGRPPPPVLVVEFLLPAEPEVLENTGPTPADRGGPP